MKIGDKVKFKGIQLFWFTDITENTKHLIQGNVYTISALQEFSSWTSIQLLETNNLQYNHMWFEVI